MRFDGLFRAFVFILILSSCSFFRQPVQRQKYLERVEKNALLIAINHLNTRFAEGQTVYAGPRLLKFKNGEALLIGTHEFVYLGVRQKDREFLHLVKARLELKSQSRKVKKKKIEIEYLFSEKPRSKKGVQLKFVYLFPEKEFVSRKDELRLFRSGPARRWLKYIQDRKVIKGMPEEAMKISLGEPNSVQKQKSFLGITKMYGYETKHIYVENGLVKNIEKP